MTEHQQSSTPHIFQGRTGAPGVAVGATVHYRTGVAGMMFTGDPATALCTAFTAVEARLTDALLTADAALAPLLEAQRLMLDDPELRDGALALVAQGVDPTTAVTTTAEQCAAVLEASTSAYFRERAIDVRAVGRAVAAAVTGNTTPTIPSGAVVLAEELSPLDTAALADAGVAALATVNGGPTCHAAIIARAWGIPALVGLPPAILTIPDGTRVRVDGVSGQLHFAHNDTQNAPHAAPAAMVHFDHAVPIYANIGSVAEAHRAAEIGAAGIGLLRTEFLFLERATPPSEDEQTALYTAIVRALGGRPVTARTLDIGADKPAPYLAQPAERNPQLGLRGIRLCLHHFDLFRTQLRALVRAAAHGPVRIMLPMVTTPDEVLRTRALLEEEAADLACPAPPLGVMIEVPMAALLAPELAAVSDFFSIGTNDLLQFLLAADREHAGVGYLYDDEHPGVWRLLEGVIQSAHAAQIPVSVCGEWGADAAKAPRLVALGIDALSVAVGVLPRVLGWGEQSL